MGKKKNRKAQEQRPSFMESLGFNNLLHNEKINFILGSLLFAVATFLMLSFVSYLFTGQGDQGLIEEMRQGELMDNKIQFANTCAKFGAFTAYFFMKQCFGLSAFVLPVFLFLISVRLIGAYRVHLGKWFFSLMILMIWSSVAMAKFLTPVFANSHFSPGGAHGIFVCQWIENLVGTPGLIVLLAIVAIIFLVLLSSETIYVIRKMLNPSKCFAGKRGERREERGERIVESDEGREESGERIDLLDDPTVFDNPSSQTVEFKINNEDLVLRQSDKAVNEDKSSSRTNKKKAQADMTIEAAVDEEKADGTDLVQVGDKEMEPYDPKRDLENYRYPTLDLLRHYDDDGKPYIDMLEQNANKNRIVEVLRTFGIEISSIKATVGPTITLYEITPAQGVRISKIRGLEDDIALSLKALGIRIIAPIPGKGTIGIEVPNAKSNIVSMESILNSKKFQETTMDLPCAMGKTITNEVFMFDLAKMPHLLVAGATGQGKSVGLNAILTSLLYKKHPAELKIVLVDPKMVEFSIYSSIANHFLAKVPDDSASPIITDTSKVVRTLQSLCVEMDARYELLMAAGERNIKDYNRKFIARKLNPEKGHKFMPYIVVVIDEYGDLIMTAGKEIELPIARIAQKARAVGIHMIIATQRPTTNIITGTIKANFPARIAFKVSQGIDSKTILDRMGAQQLIGRGDMLFLQGNEPIRVQCAFVDTPEVVDINEFIASQQGYLEPFELPLPPVGEGEMDGGSSADVDLNHLDPMFEDAARLIVQSGSGSTSLIQRKFSIGYNRAGRLMDLMEKAGVVGQAHGSKPREVLIQDEMSLEQLLNTLKNR